jgi:polysaccharide export outer membrane protein
MAAMAAMLAMAVGTAPAQEPGEPDDEAYRIEAGDLLHISVWREEDLDLDVLVRPDGGLSFPLAGDLRAADRTVEQLRAELTARLERYIPDLFVTVLVQEINGSKVYVMGQVNQPGEIIMNPRIDVMQALSLAGGMTTFSSPNDIFILRRENGQQRTMPFRFDDVVRGRNLEQNIMLRSGDVVVVP